MRRRHFLAAGVFAGLGLAAWRYWPVDGWTNPCLHPLPPELQEHPLIAAAWRGLDPQQIWDCHVHLLGDGSGDNGTWVNPQMDSLAHPIEWVQKRFYLNAACVTDAASPNRHYVERLLGLHRELQAGTRLMLLAFDYFHDSRGKRQRNLSSFYTSNRYTRDLARAHPRDLEWIASIHPYRADATDALRQAIAQGARAVKWLPAAQGMDPASAQCDPFYDVLVTNDIPLLIHVGTELAVSGGDMEDYGNPLRLRRPLDRGVRVIAAHCASLGHNVDIDRGPNAPRVSSFALFSRLMDEPAYADLLYGEISGLTQINRMSPALPRVLEREDWHPRLVNGSDYPLPGVLPLFSLKALARDDLIDWEAVPVLAEIRRYNPLLFDFVLKRSLSHKGHPFRPTVFESRRVFDARVV